MFTAVLDKKSGITNLLLMQHGNIVATGIASNKAINKQKVILEASQAIPTFIEEVYDHNDTDNIVGHIEANLFIGEDTSTYTQEDDDLCFNLDDDFDDLSDLDIDISDVDYIRNDND